MRANPFAPSLFALAVALTSSTANAQSVVTRSISAEPVETTVTQTPTGTIVTRRPVEGPIMRRPALQPPLVQTAPVVQGGPPVVARDDETIDATTTREVVERADATRAMRSRKVSARRDKAHRVPARTAQHAVRSTARTTTRPRLALNTRERHIIYQTIVEREVMPGRQVIVAPPAPQPALIERSVALPVVQPPIVAADEDAAPVYTIGSVLPSDTPLYAMPQNVALSVPAAQAYSYAYINGRAYLVDPASGMIVADVTE